jgi:hypothetical protein
MIKDQKGTYLHLHNDDEQCNSNMAGAGAWKMSLLQDYENGSTNGVVAVNGSWEVKEYEMLLLNHEKCGRQRIWNYGTLIDLKSNYYYC